MGLLFLIILIAFYVLYREPTVSFAKNLVMPLGAILVPFAIAYVGHIYSAAIKDKEIQAKLIEIATNILRETPTKDSINLRTCAVAVINQYSEIKLSTVAQKDLIENIPIYGPTLSVKIIAIDEFGNPVAGASVTLLEEVHNVFTAWASTNTDSKGKQSSQASPSAGVDFTSRSTRKAMKYTLVTFNLSDWSPS